MPGLSLAAVREARQALAGLAADTPLLPSPYLSELAGVEVLLKLETVQPTGAFKLRGAVNAMRHLPADTAGVTCCSTGNHGRAVAYAARARGLRAVICMSSLVPEVRRQGIRALGAELHIVGDSQDEAQVESRRLAAQEGLVEIPPFDDPLVIAGQGTIALELLETRPDLAGIVVPLSGGGLAAGIAFAARQIRPGLLVTGVSMDRGAAMHASIRAGKPVAVSEVESLADSLGGGIGLDNRLTFALCRDGLDATLLVSEPEIYRAMQAAYYEDGLVCEGAAAVGIAALMAGRLPVSGGPIAMIVSGRNLDMRLHAAVMQGRDVALGSQTVAGQLYDGRRPL